MWDFFSPKYPARFHRDIACATSHQEGSRQQGQPCSLHVAWGWQVVSACGCQRSGPRVRACVGLAMSLSPVPGQVECVLPQCVSASRTRSLQIQIAVCPATVHKFPTKDQGIQCSRRPGRVCVIPPQLIHDAAMLADATKYHSSSSTVLDPKGWKAVREV